MFRIAKICTAVTSLVLASGLPALAQALPAGAIALTPNDYLTIDGVTITVQSVTCTQGTSGCGTLYMAPTSGSVATAYTEGDNGVQSGSGTVDTGPAPSVTIFAVDAANGNNLVSEPCSNCFALFGNYDLTVDLTATTVAGSAPLTGASVAITGSVPNGGSAGSVNGTESINNSDQSYTYCNLSASLAAPTAACSLPAVSSVYVNKDFGPSGVGGGNGNYQLATITETFDTPEPASLACLLSGVFAIAAVRRRRSRS
ncbi:MAG TPA: hypothetical protein VMU81_01595 [Acetobacteraceae bacterium]|jgi:hypothetical protein|nr:hypothetical protein [Acetobacteraceae bacterium]